VSAAQLRKELVALFSLCRNPLRRSSGVQSAPTVGVGGIPLRFRRRVLWLSIIVSFFVGGVPSANALARSSSVAKTRVAEFSDRFASGKSAVLSKPVKDRLLEGRSALNAAGFQNRTQPNDSLNV
jgi:hypothetical protein